MKDQRCIREPEDRCIDCSPHCPNCDEFVREELLKADESKGEENKC